MIYQLRAAFIEGDREQGHSVLYTCDTYERATIAAWKWVRNRQRTLPDVFGQLGSLKVDPYVVAAPEPDGFINTGMRLGGYEWKCDWGIPPLVDEEGNPWTS